MVEAERIAKGLTEAQRRAILSAEHREANGAWHPAGLYFYADKRVRWRLACAGIVRDYLGARQSLTKFGIEVRNILRTGADHG